MKKPLQIIVIKASGAICNLNCDYCFYLDKSELYPKSSDFKMNGEVLEELIYQGMKQSGTSINFLWQGGEPSLMGLDFYKKVVELQKKYGNGKIVGNGFQTNGTLLNEEWAEFLGENKFLVGLSLDGPEHIHDKYRPYKGGKPSWKIVHDVAQMLIKKRVEVNAMISLTDYSSQFPEEIYRFHKDIGIRWLQFIPIVERDKVNKDIAASYSMHPDQYTKFLFGIFNLWYKDIEEGTQLYVRYFDSLFYKFVGLPAPDCTLEPTCGTYPVVEHNGDVYSCDYFVESKWKLGNIKETRLIDMLNSQKQDTFGKIKADLPEDCRSCEWLELCNGGCPKDRIRDPRDNGLNHFCHTFKEFLPFVQPYFMDLAEQWKSDSRNVRSAATLDVSGYL